VSVRIDKWLWAARFYKTRAQAKTAIDGGKVKVNGQRTKPAKETAVGDQIELKIGFVDRCVIVLALSDVRRGAVDAARLFEETPESIANRETQRLQRLALGPTRQTARPTKRDRRQIHRLVSKSDPFQSDP
jgi:ribosome-associated heat shock protein Hsp15